MRRKWKKALCLFLSALCLSMSLTGCKPSEKKVKNSEYYQELMDKYDKLKAENETLKTQVEKEDQNSQESERMMKYLVRIARNNLDKLEVGYYDNMEGSEFIDVEEAFVLATGIAVRANRTTRYTKESLEKLYKPIYQYVLYDENNSIYEMTIYEGDYVILQDLPNDVFYSYNASALGMAFLHYKDGYPNSNLMHRLADSPVITDSKNNCFEQERAVAAVNLIEKMDKKKTTAAKAAEDWKARRKADAEGSHEPASMVYTFYHHGNTMTLTVYDVYIRLENMDQKATWYKVSKEDARALKQSFAKSSTVYKKIKKSLKSEGHDASSMADNTEESEHLSHEHDINE